MYFGAIGGAGAVLSRFMKKLEIVAYEDLGTEAIRRLEVEELPRHRHQRLPRRRPLPGRHEAVRAGVRAELGGARRRPLRRRREGEDMRKSLSATSAARSIPGATLRTDAWWLLPPPSCWCWAASSSTRRGRRSRTPTTTPRRTCRRSTRPACRQLPTRHPARWSAPIIGILSPAFLILWVPGLFRADLLLLSQGLLPLVLARRRPARCAIGPRQLQRRDALPARAPEHPPLRLVLAVAPHPRLSLVGRHPGVQLPHGALRHGARHPRVGHQRALLSGSTRSRATRAATSAAGISTCSQAPARQATASGAAVTRLNERHIRCSRGSPCCAWG